MSRDFYEKLPVSEDFAAALADEAYRPAPEEWIIAMTDVVNSTVAIGEGRYKDVTIAGALGTIALANLTGDLNFPFLFGGDGMTFLLPGEYREAALEVLADTIQTVRELSGLELRSGVVEVREIYRAGGELKVGKVRVSPKYVQAMLSGSGLEMADELLKERRSGNLTFAGEEQLRRDRRTADFRGFSCRWLDIPSKQGETLSLIIRPLGKTGQEAMENLRTAASVVQRVVEDESAAHPLSVELHRLGGGDSTGVRAEARYLSRSTAGFRYLLRFLRIRMEQLAVWLSVRFKLPLRGMGKDLSRIPEQNVENADIRKFDGTLKMTVALTPEQRRRIIEELEQLEEQGRIYYGSHLSDRAIMTCLIHTNYREEVHFVDAADGGYALAARRIKEKLRRA